MLKSRIILFLRRCSRNHKIPEKREAAEKNSGQKKWTRWQSGVHFLIFRFSHHKPSNLLSRRRNRLDVRIGNRGFAVRDVAFHALKLRVFFPRVNLEIQYSAVVRGRRDMAHVARRDRNFFRQRVGRFQRRHVMASRAFKVGVTRKFVSKGRRRIALAPREQHDFVLDFHRRGDFRVEIRFRERNIKLVASRAVRGRGQNSRVRRMTGKTGRVPDWRGFESSLFEPESVAQFGGRLRHVFVRSVALRFVCLMANRAAAAFRRKREPRVDEERAVQRSLDFVLADNIDVFVMRKRNLEIRTRGFAFRRLVENLARVRKRVARSALRWRA